MYKTPRSSPTGSKDDPVGVVGIDEIVRRGNAYLEAGTEMIFVEAPTLFEDIKCLSKEIKGPVSINMGAVRREGSPIIFHCQNLRQWDMIE